jgi:RNA polymerase sigma-70 factor (ECF subfamily)
MRKEQVMKKLKHIKIMFAGVVLTFFAGYALGVPPKVVKTVPQNGDENVDPGLRHIRIEFDQNMSQVGYSICGSGPMYPETVGKPKWRNWRTIEIQVKLKANHEYELSINCPGYRNFKNLLGEPAEIYPISFKTAGGGTRPVESSKSTAVLLEEGLYAEEAEGDLDKAIGIYEQVLEQAGQIDRFAAKATYQLGMCYLKKGEKDIAAEYFQQVVSNFPTQSGLVARAKAELSKIEPASKGKVIELSHDDGKRAGKRSFGGGGHAVKFSSPNQNCYLKGVRIYGSRYGDQKPPREDFSVWLCDENFDPIEEFKFPYSLFKQRGRTGWVTLKTDKTKLPAEFIICVGFDPHQTKGVYVYHDKEISGNSFSGLPGGDMEEFGDGDWMIRAVIEQTVVSSAAGVKDLQGMIDSVRPGGTVTVPKGVYTEPIKITKPLTLKGESRTDCIFEVTANEPAIFIDTKGKSEVTVEDVTIKWQLATSDKGILYPFAMGVKDARATVKNCSFLPQGNFKRSPVAVRADGFSKLTVSNCRFEGFDYVICYGEGTEGAVQDSLIMNCKSQGIILYQGATADIVGNIVTGSGKHAVRSTGGTLRMKDNLIIENANRGVYLGNKSARGVISNNVIMGNGTGISGFAKSRVIIENNIIADSSYAGIGFRDSCGLQIRNNIFTGNERGWIMFKEGSRNNNGCQRNTFWQNETDAENFRKTANSISANPNFVDSDNGDFSLQPGPALENKQGLTNPDIFRNLWKIWKNREDENEPFGTAAPRPPGKTEQLEAENLTAEGWKLWGQRNMTEAEAKFIEATEKNPTNDNAFQGLGWAQLNQGKKLNAKDSFEKCVKLNPKNSAALNGLGWIAHGRGDTDEAITWWEKAVKAQPGATASLSGLTQVYMEQEQYEKAVKYYNMWLKAEPNNADAKTGLKEAKAKLNLR